MTDTKTKDTQRVSDLLVSIQEDLNVAQRMLRYGGYSALETRLTLAVHHCSDALALCADQTYGPHYWESAIAHVFVMLSEAGQISASVAKYRGYNVGMVPEVAALPKEIK